MILCGGTLNNSSGGMISGTSGTLATFICLCAKYMLSGVLEVLETPMITTSALASPKGFLPSSYLTANSTASTRLKYS